MSSLGQSRKFPRLEVAEEARVFDVDGRELGAVSQVSGSGMSMEAASLQVAQSLDPGKRLRIKIVEPGSQATNLVDVVVRNREGKKLGMEFLAIVPDGPL